MAMTVTYKIGSSIYVNLTNRCSNRCEFCIRGNGDSVGGSASLWLDREPTVEEAVQALRENAPRGDAPGCREIVFCGYGEPTERLGDLLEICRRVKPLGLPVRINTNGQADLIHGRATAPELKGLVDTVSISLNAPDSAKYDRLCHSEYGEKAFSVLLDYAKSCKAYVPHVVLSVVDVMAKDEIEACRALAENLGVEFRVRELIQ